MSKGIAVRCNVGLGSSSKRLYVQLKMGSIYKYHKDLSPKEIERMVAGLKANGKVVHLKHWQRVYKRTA